MNVITEIKKGQVGTGLLIENDGYVSMNSEANRPIMEAINAGDATSRRVLPNPFVVSAVFQKFGIENANGRIYPENVLKREVEKYQTAIAERRAYGELNHPESSAIDLSRIALNIIELHWEGHTLVGKMEIPISDGFRDHGGVYTCADILAQWLLSGLKVGVSSRGLGSVTQQMGSLIVGDDYDIVCWDAVSQPSTPQAWIEENPEKLRPYIESEKKEGTLIKEDKFSEFDEWLHLND
jgi:hypothetical protein